MGGRCENREVGEALRLRDDVDTTIGRSCTTVHPDGASCVGTRDGGRGGFSDENWAAGPAAWSAANCMATGWSWTRPNWSERQTYFLGRFYDLATQLVVRHALREGETFFDIGANIGMISLVAARCVGTRWGGRRRRTQPARRRQVEAMIRANGIEHVSLHRCGLSDKPGEATLNEVTEHSGMGTLAEVSGAGSRPGIRKLQGAGPHRGRRAAGVDCRPLVIKIDVEGYECQVLRGVRQTLERLRPAVVAEVVPQWLERGRRVGRRPVRADGGLRVPRILAGAQAPLVRYSLNLRPIGGAGDLRGETNVVWLPSDGVHADRLRPWIEAEYPPPGGGRSRNRMENGSSPTDQVDAGTRESDGWTRANTGAPRGEDDV